MRKIFAAALLISLILCSISEAGGIRRFPSDGICVGDYVRFRSGPGTNYRILGRMFDGERVTVISQYRRGGRLWYEIYDPYSGDRTVWVAAEYILPD